MDRRKFLKRMMQSGMGLSAFGLFGCGRKEDWITQSGRYNIIDGVDHVILYDTYAMALYMDGGLGPKTGIIKVDYILDNQPVELKFWHGHGGKSHYYTVTPDHFSQFKSLTKTYVRTNEVASHTHRLFIDPVDPRWRIPGAEPVPVPLDRFIY